MKRGTVWTCVAFAACGGIVPVDSAAQPAQIDFDAPELLGTSFGGGEGNSPGDLVPVDGMIAMTLEEFFVGQFVGFNVATIGGRFAEFFPTAPLELNNISALFDFTNVGFDVTTVTLDYMEFGGADNFAVNLDVVSDDTVYILNSLTELPTAVAPGVTATVEENVGITLTGNITSFLIGGQELSIDNVVALPEPTSLLLLAFGVGTLVVRRSAC